jgi:hypothetical protein
MRQHPQRASLLLRQAAAFYAPLDRPAPKPASVTTSNKDTRQLKLEQVEHGNNDAPKS